MLLSAGEKPAAAAQSWVKRTAMAPCSFSSSLCQMCCSHHACFVPLAFLTYSKLSLSNLWEGGFKTDSHRLPQLERVWMVGVQSGKADGLNQPGWCGHPNSLHFHQHCPIAAATQLVQHWSCVSNRSTKSSHWATPHCQLPNIYCTSLANHNRNLAWPKPKEKDAFLGMEAKSIIS